MVNSMLPEVAAGVITSVTIILIVVFNVVRFNKEQKGKIHA
ncbi:hypothetical protein EDB95_3948 [Dinghuibacter silviterrae]|uniref:Uncharacterized protein n=1 Tax=Dinghuibacter silviterrae TaxID=1539049 RepID=A0A4R8DF92_9BACT|nr:hypothetical protein EDB95_3948 [Dinghuibacter silviterrae]